MFKNSGKKSYVDDICADNNLELSDDDSNDNNDEETSKTEAVRDLSFISKQTPGASKQEAEECLPSAEKMFKSVTKAGFLDVKNKEDIDWDKMITSKSEELDVKCSNTHAMPPPKSYESQSPALKPTLGDTTVIKTSRKRHAGNDDDTEETAHDASSEKLSKSDLTEDSSVNEDDS